MKKVGFPPKTNFCLGKNWFFAQHHFLLGQRLVFPPKALLPGENQTLESGRIFPKRKINVFCPRKELVFGGKPTLSQEKDGFGLKNQLFPREKMVLGWKTNFFLVKTKQRLFLESGRIVSQKCFFGFPYEVGFFGPKPSFSSEKLTRRRNCS